MWSYILATLSIIALYTKTQNQTYITILTTLNQTLWIIYGYTTKQYGFIIAAITYATANITHKKHQKQQQQHQNNTQQNKHIKYIDFTPNTTKPLSNNN
jgi:hypothetical protein